MNNIFQRTMLIGACVAGLTACAETRTEREFGDSVRTVLWHQVYAPNAGLAAGNDPAMGGDGHRLEGVLEVYRGDAAATEGVAKPVNVQVGSGSR